MTEVDQVPRDELLPVTGDNSFGQNQAVRPDQMLVSCMKVFGTKFTEAIQLKVDQSMGTIINAKSCMMSSKHWALYWKRNSSTVLQWLSSCSPGKLFKAASEQRVVCR